MGGYNCIPVHYAGRGSEWVLTSMCCWSAIDTARESEVRVTSNLVRRSQSESIAKHGRAVLRPSSSVSMKAIPGRQSFVTAPGTRAWRARFTMMSYTAVSEGGVVTRSPSMRRQRAPLSMLDTANQRWR
jgi:hypothetical protein